LRGEFSGSEKRKKRGEYHKKSRDRSLGETSDDFLEFVPGEKLEKQKAKSHALPEERNQGGKGTAGILAQKKTPGSCLR